MLEAIENKDVTITGIMSGGDNYQDANPSYTITVGKAKQEELNFAQKNPDAIFYGDAFTNIATGGSTDESIKATIAAGANSIIYTPPCTSDLFKDKMSSYREGELNE